MQSLEMCRRIKFRSAKYKAWLRQVCQARINYKLYKKTGIGAWEPRWMAVVGSEADRCQRDWARGIGPARADFEREYAMYFKAWQMYARADGKPRVFG